MLAYPKTFRFHEKLNKKINPIEICDALHPVKLAKRYEAEDTVAVFGSSHSSVLIIRELTKRVVKKILIFIQRQGSMKTLFNKACHQ